MPHLLHIDSSIQGDRSISRKLTARAAEAWKAANPNGTVTYRDLSAQPLPHLDGVAASTRMTPPSDQSAEQAAAYAISVELIDEIKAADTVLLGLPVYNFGAPSTVKAWVDHIVFPGLSVDPETHAGLLGERELIVIISRGGGYAPGTPREGWDHAEQWLPHGIVLTGLEPRFIVAELTLANVNPAMAEFKGLAAESLATAERQIDELWAPVSAAA
jgi:FMN-dependent NADH-azoreductase